MKVGAAETSDARAAVDLAVSEADPLLNKWSTDKERAQFAERRHMFWRNRCLEHARLIDRQSKQIHALEEVIAALRDDRSAGGSVLDDFATGGAKATGSKA